MVSRILTIVINHGDDNRSQLKEFDMVLTMFDIDLSLNRVSRCPSERA